MKVLDQHWDELIKDLETLSLGGEQSELRMVHFTLKLAQLNLIQPFDWMHWHEPYPATAQVKMMDLETAVKHITRIVRADRFMEGTLMACIKSGLLLGLCLVARERSHGEQVPGVMSKAT